MTTIDEQNSRQIRQPMDVLITMSLADDEVNMTYSGYSTAKVADGVLDQSSWPMRKLADLQGDGFPLDGSCVLYNASTSPSQANGKLGVRSNVGEAVTVTATGDRTMASIGASVTGAESVTMNGTTTPITGTNVTLPLLDTTATLTFNPASETRRIEINTVLPEADFKITNENLIRATVSLRSDLSIIGPTLPESEINIEAYFDEDVSEAVAAIPEDTPIKYQAGYPGDMSPERKFYVTGQVTWADNVLTIQGVDAVHFLEKQLPSAIMLNGASRIRHTLAWMMKDANIQAHIETYKKSFFSNQRYAIFERQSYRDVIKNLQWMFNVPKEGIEFFPAYIDAGIPTFRFNLPQSSAQISEDDCGDIKRNVDKSINSITYESYNHNMSDFESRGNVGSYDWYKNNGMFLSIDEHTLFCAASLTNEEFRESQYQTWSSTGASSIAPNATDGYAMLRWSRLEPNNSASARLLLDDKVLQNRAGSSDGYHYTQIIPWNCYYAPGAFDHPYWGNIRSMSDMWRYLTSVGIFEEGTINFSGALWGSKLQKQPETIVKGTGSNDGLIINVEDVWGQIYASDDGERVFPNQGIEWLLGLSNITGSFIWKGDPRMQPRDVVEWERLDGTTTTITLENITLTHEGGGTMAEITYREGVV